MKVTLSRMCYYDDLLLILTLYTLVLIIFVLKCPSWYNLLQQIKYTTFLSSIDIINLTYIDEDILTFLIT